MRARAGMIALLAALLLAVTPALAAAACPATSLPEIEDEVMCPICGVPLINAGGQQAENQRDFIRELVDECKTEKQIKAALVEEYGEDVLAVPRKEGFVLAAYIVPVAGFALAGAGLAVGVARWRRRRDEPDGGEPAPPASEASSELDSDLRRYDL